MKIPVTFSEEQAKAVTVSGEASLEDFIQWQRDTAAADANIRISSGGGISLPIKRQWGLTIFKSEHLEYKALTPQVDDFIASEPLQYHPPRKADGDKPAVGATVVRLSRGKNDNPVVYHNEDAEEWKRLNGVGPIAMAKARVPGQEIVERKEVNAATVGAK